MSHYGKYKDLQMTDPALLHKALLALGKDKAELHAERVDLYTYLGKVQEGRKANVVIRRDNVGHLCNDVGFDVSDEGTKVHICDFAAKREGFGKDFLNSLGQQYQVESMVQAYEDQGYEHIEVVTARDGRKAVFAALT